MDYSALLLYYVYFSGKDELKYFWWVIVNFVSYLIVALSCPLNLAII